MNRTKRTLVVLLALSAGVTLAACGERVAHDHDDHAEDGAESSAGHSEAGHEETREVRVPLAGLRGLAFQWVGEPRS